MIEYSIEELKYYYNNYGDYTKDEIETINYLEDTLSDIIDKDYTDNNIYHIFPSIVGATGAISVALFILSIFIT
jgi:hypothetical protein